MLTVQLSWQSNFNKGKLGIGTLNDNGLKQVIKKFTRMTKKSKTLIDNIIANNEMVSAKNNIKSNVTECIDILLGMVTVGKYRIYSIIISAIIELNEIDNVNE